MFFCLSPCHHVSWHIPQSLQIKLSKCAGRLILTRIEQRIFFAFLSNGSNRFIKFLSKFPKMSVSSGPFLDSPRRLKTHRFNDRHRDKNARCPDGRWWPAPACRSDLTKCIPTFTASPGWKLQAMMQWTLGMS